MHKKCSGIKGPLCPDPEFRCIRCLGTARAIGGIEDTEVEVGTEKLKVVPEFGHAPIGGGFPFSQTAIYPFLPEVGYTQHA